ncbi:MAG: 50S ribosomal protein L30 [Actinobacteria bacterium]|jgi:large subunit ribosomal protein L30|nr:50S ribosomal protein L30 [Acidimicrobiia bacterium]NDF87599.1 50S ribosomal protein L30 [Actinomycetota bacterium]
MATSKKVAKPVKKAVAKKSVAVKATRKTHTGATFVVKQVRSQIGIMPKTKATMRALGLRKIGDVNTLPDRPEIRGMIARVPHLIEVSKKGA